MHLPENELYEKIADIQDSKRKDSVVIPPELAKEAQITLGKKQRIKVDRTTPEGRKLLAFAKNERNKRKRKRKLANKARKKNRAK